MKIALSGIVKNESKIIERCLSNCKNVMDFVAITDTGSTDGTPELIETWCRNNNIPCKVFRSKWVNFSHSRTEALRNSEKAFPQADYLLLVDADMILENHGLDKDNLSEDSYHVEQYNDNIKYDNVRLVSTKHQWYYVGVTHEYITTDTKATQSRLETLRILDIGDGGSKSDKFARDISLLSTELKKGNLDTGLKSRYTFYLAQSFFDTKQFSKALRQYRTRTELGGYDMEIWFSMYKIGLCLKELDRWDEAEIAFLNAYSMKPYRCEPLVEIVQYHVFKTKPDYNRAELYIHKLIKLRDMPNLDGLFNIAHYKEYYIDYLISILGFYCNEKDMGLRSCKRVLDSNAPLWVKINTQNNLEYYE